MGPDDLGMVAFWALVFGAIVKIVRGGAAEGLRPPERSPEQILAERLARGEIDEDDYHGRLDVLRGVRRRDTSPRVGA